LSGGGRATVEVRIATAADEPALTTIDLDSRSNAVTPAPDPDPGFALFDGRAEPESTLVAILDGEPAGLIALARPTTLESHRHVLEVIDLAVAPAHQRQGIGRTLLEAAAELARSRGARRLTLRVLSSNPGARALYEDCGFVVEGVLRGEFLLDGAYVDDVLMALALDPGN
jgi:ribosomal protein S18 acetylase RimI-like enzyme